MAQLEDIQAELDALRKSNAIKPRRLVAIALQLGRHKGKRGKEPVYVSDRPGWFPIAIPNHPTLKKGTANNIIKQLQHDVDRLMAVQA